MDPAVTDIPFNDLRPQTAALEPEIISALQRVLQRGWFILGEENELFERAFGEYLSRGGQALQVATVANGTDALELAVRALDIASNDEVITVPHTATFTALGLSAAGVRLRFVDIDPDTYLMDPGKLEDAITPRTRAIVPVHLYGQTADLTAIMAIAGRHGIPVIEDVAQAHGATAGGRQAGSIGACSAFSFYPTKNLGAYGDGGAIATPDPALAERVRSLRNGGMGNRRYHHDRIGVNSRLDEMQAAVLRVKLPYLNAANDRRRAIARQYTDQLSGLSGFGLSTPQTLPGNGHVYHLYVVRVSGGRRNALAAHLKSLNIGTNIHYPVPIHLQPAYAELGLGPGSFPVSERAAEEVLSLPLYPEMTDEQVATVCDAIGRYYSRQPARVV